MGTRFLYESSSPNTRSRPVGSIFYPFAPGPPTLPVSPPPPPPPLPSSSPPPPTRPSYAPPPPPPPRPSSSPRPPTRPSYAPPPPLPSSSPPPPTRPSYAPPPPPLPSSSPRPPTRPSITPPSPLPPPSSPPPPPSSSGSPPTPAPSSFSSAGLIAGIAVIAVAILLVFSVFGISYWKNKKRRRNDGKGPKGINAIGFSKSAVFTYEELARATDGFSDANLLGQGGFGFVHRGLLPNGKKVAVKQLKAGSGQGEREFRAEAEILSRVHHKHLVSLVGYCITGTHRLLVYEFVPNNTLEFHLHGQGPTLDWPTRMRIALGVAKGLAYLHEDCPTKIIHRDIKAANILLDFKFEAKVADFGLAKFCPDINTYVSTRVMGTFGYLAPEYALSGKRTKKADIFSFGVMLLELITGRRPLGSHHTLMEDSLVEWAMPLLTRALEEENFNSLVDPRLPSQYEPNEMARMVQCAAASIRYSANCRPSMSQIVHALEGEASLVAEYTSIGSSDYDTAQYKEDMQMFRKMVLLGSRQIGGNQ